jgi:hypothetical protein
MRGGEAVGAWYDEAAQVHAAENDVPEVHHVSDADMCAASEKVGDQAST